MNSNSHIFRAALTLLLILAPLTIAAQDLGLTTVVIDPGHGGKDAGCVSVDRKTMEKDLVLDISTKLRDRIREAYPGVKVLMTRSKDEFIELSARAQYANKNHSSLFISVHINSADGKKSGPNGYSVHILGQSTDKNKDTYAFNMDVCKRENEVILLEDDYSTTYQGFDPNDPESDIFLRLMANSYREQSLLFAQKVNDRLKSGPFSKSNGIYQNNFAVLRLASMPAVLLELGFMSNPSDLAQLRKPASIDKIVTNLFEAFCDYKTIYDESVGAKKVLPVKPSGKAEAKSAAPSAAADAAAPQAPALPAAADASASAEKGVYYATQVLATSKEMDSKDAYFLGYEPECIVSGKLRKYFIGVSEDINSAKEMYSKIHAKYRDSFLVKVENGVSVRVSQ